MNLHHQKSDLELMALHNCSEIANGAMLHMKDFLTLKVVPKDALTHATKRKDASSSITTPPMVNASNATPMPLTALKASPTAATTTSTQQTEEVTELVVKPTTLLVSLVIAKNVAPEEDTSETLQETTPNPALKDAKENPAAATSSTILTMASACKSPVTTTTAMETSATPPGTTSTECEVKLNTTKTYF